MVRRILEAKGGEVHEVQSDVKGEMGLNSYQTGGFSYTASLGRVDAAFATIQSDSQVAKVTAINSPNEVVIQLFSQGSGAAADEGSEIDSLFIADNIQVDSYRL